MQNSALAAVLAQSFSSPTLTALPACISATCHRYPNVNISLSYRHIPFPV